MRSRQRLLRCHYAHDCPCSTEAVCTQAAPTAAVFLAPAPLRRSTSGAEGSKAGAGADEYLKDVRRAAEAAAVGSCAHQRGAGRARGQHLRNHAEAGISGTRQRRPSKESGTEKAISGSSASWFIN
jgi:hypothetical protein